MQEVITKPDLNYEFLVPFRNKLTQGSLYPKIGLLVDSILKDLQISMQEKQERLQAVFRKIRRQIEIFLESQLNYDITLKSLRLNLVSAYMITSPRSRLKV